MPAAVQVEYRPFGFTVFAFPVPFYEHSGRDQYQANYQDDWEKYISKYTVVRIIVTGKQRLNKKDDNKDEAVNGKDCSNNADPVGY